MDQSGEIYNPCQRWARSILATWCAVALCTAVFRFPGDCRGVRCSSPPDWLMSSSYHCFLGCTGWPLYSCKDCFKDMRLSTKRHKPPSSVVGCAVWCQCTSISVHELPIAYVLWQRVDDLWPCSLGSDAHLADVKNSLFNWSLWIQTPHKWSSSVLGCLGSFCRCVSVFPSPEMDFTQFWFSVAMQSIFHKTESFHHFIAQDKVVTEQKLKRSHNIRLYLSLAEATKFVLALCNICQSIFWWHDSSRWKANVYHGRKHNEFTHSFPHGEHTLWRQGWVQYFWRNLPGVAIIPKKGKQQTIRWNSLKQNWCKHFFPVNFSWFKELGSRGSLGSVHILHHRQRTVILIRILLSVQFPERTWRGKDTNQWRQLLMAP